MKEVRGGIFKDSSTSSSSLHCECKKRRDLYVVGKERCESKSFWKDV